MSSLASAPSSGASAAAVLLVVAIALAGAVVVAVIARRRRRAAVALAVRRSVLTELERDPALGGLQLTLETYTEWTGEIVVRVAGTVRSPWYRYAVIRAAQRALARTFRNTRLDDRIVVDTQRALPALQRRTA